MHIYINIHENMQLCILPEKQVEKRLVRVKIYKMRNMKKKFEKNTETLLTNAENVCIMYA